MTLIGVPRETATGERRVALVPKAVERLRAAGLDVTVEIGAGAGALIPDEQYERAGACIGDPWSAGQTGHGPRARRGRRGLQALATATRLGARTTGFDVRPEVAEQVRSLGAQWLELGVEASGEGGYARALTEEGQAA